MNGTETLTIVGITTAIGFVFPTIAAAVKRYVSDKLKQDMLILLLLVLVAAGSFFVIGDIDATACEGLDLIGCVAVLLGYVGLTMTQAFTWYKNFWKPSGLDGRISGKG